MKRMIVLMGGQGVGKGTFARMLCEKYDFNYIETGAILRNAAKTNPVIDNIIKQGTLVPFETLIQIIANNISADKDVVLDGFPRTLEQAKWLINTYSKEFQIHVIFLSVPKDILIKRIQKRIREGGGRTDDASDAIINKRLQIFEQETLPAIKWLSTISNIQFSEVSVPGDVQDNFAKILAVL